MIRTASTRVSLDITPTPSRTDSTSALPSRPTPDRAAPPPCDRRDRASRRLAPGCSGEGLLTALTEGAGRRTAQPMRAGQRGAGAPVAARGSARGLVGLDDRLRDASPVAHLVPVLTGPLYRRTSRTRSPAQPALRHALIVPPGSPNSPADRTPTDPRPADHQRVRNGHDRSAAQTGFWNGGDRVLERR